MNPTRLSGLLVVILSAIAGCGGGDPPPEEPVRVRVLGMNGTPLDEADPVVLDLENPARFALTGTGFGEPDSVATVVFRTADGSTPFIGGTLGAIEVPGLVVSDTEIEGVLALPGVANPIDVTVEVEVVDLDVSPPAAGVRLEDSSLEAPSALGPARFLDLDADGHAGPGDEIVVEFDRRIKVDGAVDVQLLPAGSLGRNPPAPYVGGPERNQLHVPMGESPALRTRSAYDQLIVTNAPTAIEIRMDSGVANVVDETPESDVVLDIVPGHAVGQELTDPFGKPIVSDTRGLVCGDFDRDGLPDVVAVDYRGALVLFRGRQAPAGLEAGVPLDLFAIDNGKKTEVTIGTGFFAGAAAGDLNGDCALDLVVARTGGRDWILVWNETEQGFERVQQLSLQDSSAVALGDLDHDGDLDIVTANQGGGSRIWENAWSDGAETRFIDSGLRLNPESDTAAVVLDDVDADGDLDIVLGHFGESNSVWRNGPKAASDASAFPRTFGADDLVPGTFVAEPEMAAARTFGLASGDLDGDGDLDYVEAIFEGAVQVWIQDDAAAPARFLAGQSFCDELNCDPAGDRRAIALGDVDGDGDLDVIAGTASSGTSVWFNDGTGNFTDSRQRLGDGRVRALALADFDADGDLDFVTGHAGAADRLWFNSLSGTWGEANFEAAPTASPTWMAAIAIAAGEAGEDYRMACADLSGRNEMWRSVSGEPERVRALNDSLEARSVALGDFDGDGTTDAVIAHAGGLEIEWGDDTLAAWESPGTTYRRVSLLDIDDNGVLDLVAVRDEGLEVRFNGDLVTAPQQVGAPGGGYRDFAAADLDGDGATDLAGAHTGGIDFWCGPTFASCVKGIDVTGGIRAIVAFNVDGDVYQERKVAATSNKNVDVDHTNAKFVLSTGTWTSTPSNGRTIYVTGTTKNNGTYTVKSSSSTEIVVNGTLADEGTADPAITIVWDLPTTAPALDLVATTPDKVISLRNDGVQGLLGFGSAVTVASMEATGLAAGAAEVVASDANGFIVWERVGTALQQSVADRDGPAADAVAVGPGGEIVIARSGAGHEILNVGLFAFAKGTTALHDLDQDGDLDLVSTGSDGVNRIHWNDGIGFAGPEAVGHGFAAVGDVDRDGDLDLVTGNANGLGVQIWSNDAGSFTAGVVLLDSEVTRAARIADVFGTGRPAILVVSAFGVQIFENDGSGTFSGREVAAQEDVLEIAVVDLNRDCLLDVVMATPGGIRRTFAQPGGGFVPVAGTFLAGAGDTRALALADVDRDGRPDLLSGGRGSPIRIWGNVGATNPFGPALSSGSIWIEALALCDLDGDGRSDWIAGKFGEANQIGLSGKPSTDPLGGLWTDALGTGDIDRDGDIDIAVRNRESAAPDVTINE